MPDAAMVRSFVGLAEGADTATVDMCLKAAKAWYKKAGVPEPATPADPPEGETADTTDVDGYDFWVCNLAAFFYDNRGAIGAEAQIPSYILASVHQLRPIPVDEVST